MPTPLVLATRNAGKMAELQALLPQYQLLSLDDISFTEDTAEPYHTFAENAHFKAKAVFDASGYATLADDSGLSVPALNGLPGVQSKRYAGLCATDADNVAKLMHEMRGHENRYAFFTTVLCLLLPGAAAPFYFEGTCKGSIAAARSGSGGFGYDPVFIPEGFEVTFAQLSHEQKNSISHRGAAIRGMTAAIQELYPA